MIEIGSTVGGYTLESLLGRGNGGAVFRAIEKGTGRTVALKILDGGGGYRNRREMAAVSRLRHPGLVAVLECRLDAEIPFIAMELVEGPTLERVLGSPLPWVLSVQILKQLAEVLVYVHKEGILHRDIKPSNILMASQNNPKLVDFGLCRSETDTRHTEPGALIGAFRYIAPECLTGAAPASFRTDLWSLGVVAYRMLTGHWHVKGEPRTVVEWVQTLHREPIQAPAEYAAMPAAVSHLVQQLLAKDPEARLSSASACVTLCDRILAPTAPPSPKRRQPVWFALLGAAAVAAVLAAGLPGATTPQPKLNSGYLATEKQFNDAFDDAARELDRALVAYSRKEYVDSRAHLNRCVAHVQRAEAPMKRVIGRRSAIYHEEPATIVRESYWSPLGQTVAHLNLDLAAKKY
jgi:serine/threonine protein kinase